MRLVTLSCRGCDLEPVAAPYDDDDDPMAVGLVAGIASQHRGAYPDHALALRSETPDQVETRLTEERAALEKETRRAAEAVRRRNAESVRRHQQAVWTQP